MSNEAAMMKELAAAYAADLEYFRGVRLVEWPNAQLLICAGSQAKEIDRLIAGGFGTLAVNRTRYLIYTVREIHRRNIFN